MQIGAQDEQGFIELVRQPHDQLVIEILGSGLKLDIGHRRPILSGGTWRGKIESQRTAEHAGHVVVDPEIVMPPMPYVIFQWFPRSIITVSSPSIPIVHRDDAIHWVTH